MKKAVCLLAALVLAAVLSGCGLIRIEEEERKPVDYTVVERQDIPAALDEIMNEKKEKEFQLSYETGEALYLAKGYGQQMSGGYSIQVEELGASSNGLFFVTRLIGPKDLNEAGVPSYPCIVIKTEPQKKPVVFREGKADSGSEKGE
ncbi:protease complex subunit PrcB family protein [Ruminococcus sp. AF46-10NS]|nr:protease complex subunit PrcB family protein [Ruminococcus sp. AF46-10NS]RHK24981.1 protease complex subunit PrcB family protein [Ruminococcus sp. AF46-10NS]